MPEERANSQTETPTERCWGSLTLSVRASRVFAFSRWLWCPTGEDHPPLPLLTSLHTEMGWWIQKSEENWGYLDCILGEWRVLKVVEVLPRHFIFIVKYSVHMVDRGNFCSQPGIQKWKGCGLWMKGAADRHAWGFMVVRWEAASCWWVTVWAWRLRTCPLKDDAIRYLHLCWAYIHTPPRLMHRRAISAAVFWSLCRAVWASVLHVWVGIVDLLAYDQWVKPRLHWATSEMLKWCLSERLLRDKSLGKFD